MTENEWNVAEDPWLMFKHMRPERHAYARKFWLYGAACCRRIWPLITHPASKRAVQAAEEFADNQLSRLDLEAVSAAAHHIEGIDVDEDHPAGAAASAADYCSPDGAANAHGAGELAAEAVAERSSDPSAKKLEERAQCDLLRDLFGPLPFRTIHLDPAWLSWDGGRVHALAGLMYAARTFDRMVELGDALASAGCTDAEILSHCRQGGVHVRGCWVVDLILAGGRKS